MEEESEDSDQPQFAINLNNWKFSEKCRLLCLPLDPVRENYLRRSVRNSVFSIVKPTPLKNPKLVAYSTEALLALDMDPSIAETKDFIDFVNGEKELKNSIPMAHRYGGYQYGVWASQLGDGRAHFLGDYLNNHGDRFELQLKGSGKTPYSRNMDGRTVLRSAIREFICSEAMHALRIATTRAIALIVGEDTVMRDIYYTGNPVPEKAAILLRTAKSFFRFGSLDILYQSAELETLKILVDFIIKEYFDGVDPEDENRILHFYSTVVRETAELVAEWHSVGFAHGTLNSDNMSILSITMDYGPFGFLDEYNVKFLPNSSDREGRYRIDSQPAVVLNNLETLALSLSPLLSKAQKYHLPIISRSFVDVHQYKMMELFRAKLGLSEPMEHDDTLFTDLLEIMEDTNADFTMTFVQLGEIRLDDLHNNDAIKKYWSLALLARHIQYDTFVEMYYHRVMREGITEDERSERMQAVNPRYVPRNWMLQEAIADAEKGDFDKVRLLHEILQNPFLKQEKAEALGYASPPPSWSNKLRVSCSS